VITIFIVRVFLMCEICELILRVASYRQYICLRLKSISVSSPAFSRIAYHISLKMEMISQQKNLLEGFHVHRTSNLQNKDEVAMSKTIKLWLTGFHDDQLFFCDYFPVALVPREI